MKLLLSLLLASFAVSAQTQTHSVTLLWTDTANPAGTTYNIYRLTGSCPATPPTLANLGGFTLINASPLTTKSYVDTNVTGGTTYCYVADAISGANTSAFSNQIGPAVPSLFAPGISVTVAQ